MKSNNGVNAITDLSFQVRLGEIYGIAGIGGNGQNELVEILSGLSKIDTGSIELSHVGRIENATPIELRNLGIVCIHSDRETYGLAYGLNIAENFSISGVLAGEFGSYIKVKHKLIHEATKLAIEAYDVRGVRALNQKAGLLSGGNAQKLVIAREFSREPSIVVAHSPCRGLDVRASSAVHEYLLKARDRGGAVVLISEDLDEILLMSDRIGVMSGGAIVAEFDAPANRNEIGKSMTGHG